MLRWSNSTTKIRRESILGVMELNMLPNPDFLDKLKYYVTRFITKTGDLYEKYDIENGIFSRLQNNEKLHADKYRLILSKRKTMVA